ncbi:S8 family serine peptidase [Paenibacillus sp. GCM10012307]|uniref:S8 family serine peptidase n=1 Tax=Paenibacillus roseus TaxID=2798579 RepID=A0A934J569_9BACL|nr:S8 family serine peptidase [Paenibacillus roseus]MBJ6361894.1 S8 family serine peptidase [Paenibacillus roseus]
MMKTWVRVYTDKGKTIKRAAIPAIGKRWLLLLFVMQFVLVAVLSPSISAAPSSQDGKLNSELIQESQPAMVMEQEETDTALKEEESIAVPPEVEVETPESVDGTWFLKWRDPELDPAAMPDNTILVKHMSETGVNLVRPKPETDLEAWLIALRGNPDIEYVQANGKVQLLSSVTPDDPLFDKQSYLNQIGIKKAWESGTSQTKLTIAVVDTGADLTHPDLKDNLVKGTNLVSPGKQPQDDNGHGTRVAGVLAAVGNNGAGISGMLWRAKIMPIKALDEDGYGDEDRLGEAILYAVKNGAKIVVLSVGLYRESPYMHDIVKYAESNGVLLVAATGNDGLLLKSKVSVKYPAAYPTVLAVGGATAGGKTEPRSNSGPEVDIVAPWTVYTTALGGGYAQEQGTSMSTPQVAGVAALVWAKYPDMKPYQIRELLKQTAKNIGPKGWDPQTGYGLLQADAALTVPYKVDFREPNDTRGTAFPFSIASQLAGQLTTGKDKDYFKMDIPYDGTLTIQFQGMTNSGQAMPPVKIAYYSASQKLDEKLVKMGTTSVDLKVKQGQGHLEIKFDSEQQKETIPYLLTSSFTIAPDDFEDNDSIIKSFTLSPRNQKLTGTFHQTGDRDWFSITFAQAGTLKLKMETDTVRIDPAMAFGRAGDAMLEIDENSDGEPEESPQINVTPGKYYIRINNAAASNASPVVGIYTLSIEFLSVYEDPNEPNNKPYEATSVRPDTTYVGVIDPVNDQDWFQMRLTGESVVTIRLGDIPVNRTMGMEVFDKTQKSLFSSRSVSGSTSITTNRKLAAGTYFIKLSANAAFNHQYYRFSVQIDKLVAGFRDIDGHWAKDAIVALARDGMINGTGGYRFEPNRPITRAEAVALLVKAFPTGKSDTAGNMAFKDLKSSHWAYNSIREAVNSGWVKGYSNGTFAPDRSITRAEMASMLGMAMGLKTYQVATNPFNDVKANHWAAPMISALKQSGWIDGYADRTFKPNGQAVRAEFAAILYRALR